MDLIIRAIIAIFEAIFEQDAKKRRPAQRQPQARGKPQTLEEYKAELRRQEKAARRQQPAKPRSKPLAERQVLPPQIPATAAYREEDARHPADHSFLVHFDPESIHHPTEVTKAQRQPFAIPGQTETQKLIWAQTVLGPCKAHQKMGIPRRT